MVGPIFSSTQNLAVLLSGVYFVCALRYLTVHFTSIKKHYQHFLSMVVLVFALFFYHVNPGWIQWRSAAGMKSHLEARCEVSTGACMMRARVAVSDGDWVMVEKLLAYVAAQGDESMLYKKIAILLDIHSRAQDIEERVLSWLAVHPHDVETLEFMARSQLEQGQTALALKYYQLLYDQCYDELQKAKIAWILQNIKES